MSGIHIDINKFKESIGKSTLNEPDSNKITKTEDTKKETISDTTNTMTKNENTTKELETNTVIKNEG